MKTPSRWHDDTMSRDAGHDDMHLAVWRYLSSKEKEMRFGDIMCNRDALIFEYPILRGLVTVAYADIVAELSPIDESDHRRIFHVYEIKPKIYSVGGIVRQCNELRNLMNEEFKHQKPLVSVKPVVPWNDPKIADLREVMGGDFLVIGWDAEEGCYAPPSRRS